MDPIRVGIAGCHRMLERAPAPHNPASALAALPGVRVVGVSDLGEECRARFLATWGDTWPGMQAFADHEAMLRALRPELVLVENTHRERADTIAIALACGARGILSNKPLCTTLDEADRIGAGCARHGAAFAFALDRRWSPAGARLRKLVADGLVGRVQGVALHGVPELIDHGCHWIDVGLGFLGDAEPRWAMGHCDAPSDDYARLDPPGRGMVGFDGGAHLAIATGGGGPIPSVQVLGDRGRLLVLNWYLTEIPAEAWLLPAQLDEPSGGTRLRRIDLGPLDPTWPHGRAMVADLVEAMRSGRETACGLAHARRATEIGFALHASHHRDARVAFPVVERGLRVPGHPWGNERPLAARAGAAS